ncbi:MAG: Flp family type IVb pilin [Alphaproteobacteria bacterium]|nr:Flp family type IVb pilin [Alphaproteobacteria bacterium]
MLKLIAFVQAYTSDFGKKEDGATAIEYGLIAAGIALAISGAVWTFGGELKALFDGMGSKLAAPTP